MPCLVIQLDDTRLAVAIEGAITIGREAGNAVVIDHPTVSRRHARIDARGEQAQLSDLGSKNGTRLNGRVVVHGQPLCDGARLRIGQVLCWFFFERPAERVIEQLTSPREKTPSRGSSARCACGTKLWARSETALRETPCPACGRVGEFTQPPRDASAETFLAHAPASAKCGVCQWAIEPGDEQVICPDCAATFHGECWRENRGCSTYGCSKVNALEVVSSAASPFASTSLFSSVPITDGPPTAHDEGVRRVGRLMLGAAIAAAVLSTIAFGVPSLLTLLAVLIFRPRTTDGWAAAAAVTSFAGLLAGIAISGAVWLHWSL
jgi:phage FluMu protein Com